MPASLILESEKQESLRSKPDVFQLLENGTIAHIKLPEIQPIS